MPATPNIIGNRFGRLVVSSRERRNDKPVWICKCDCGKSTLVNTNSLTSGNTTSCGCYKKERTLQGNHKHGMKKSREYRSFIDMRSRCNNKNDSSYSYYGGRGITVCKEWNEFNRFYADMGNCPYGYTLDRINNDLNYSKDNCRWANRSDQAINRRYKKSNTGEKGIHFENGKYRAYIKRLGVHKHLGTFLMIDDAILARKAAEFSWIRTNEKGKAE